MKPSSHHLKLDTDANPSKRKCQSDHIITQRQLKCALLPLPFIGSPVTCPAIQ
ncbi:unnamed protein product, partial [Ceratitis capitata]